MKFKDRLTLLRTQKGWTKKDTAKMIGISTGAYANYEYGNREPNQEIIKKIAKTFNVSVDYLINGEKELSNAFTSTVFNEDLQKQIIDLQKSFSSIISTNQKNDSLNDLRADLLTKDINFETNKESESLNKTLEALENYLNALTDRSIKINYSELMLLKEIITLFSDVRDSSISNEEQFFIYSSLTDTINQIRKNLN